MTAARALDGIDAPPSATDDEVAAVAAAVARHLADEDDEGDGHDVEHWVLTGRIRAFGDEDVGRPIWDGATDPWALAGRHDRF